MVMSTVRGCRSRSLFLRSSRRSVRESLRWCRFCRSPQS